MKRMYLASALVGAAILGGSLAVSFAGASTPAKQDISAPMRTVLLPPIPAPPVAPVVAAQPTQPAPVAPPAPASPRVVTTFSTTAPLTPTPAPAPAPAPAPVQPGPQPAQAPVTIQVPQCVVTWTVTTSTGSNPGYFAGNCTDAAAVAADWPGSQIKQVTVPVQTGPSEAAGATP